MSTIIFIIGFVINITSDTSLYNVDLNVVPDMQNNSSLGSTAFINFMNVISNFFNPVICAGYVTLFWLISSRKLEIMVFLTWFIFLSWLLSVLKMSIQYQIINIVNRDHIGIKLRELRCLSGHVIANLVVLQDTQCWA
jgi:hypothetical protein